MRIIIPCRIWLSVRPTAAFGRRPPGGRLPGGRSGRLLPAVVCSSATKASEMTDLMRIISVPVVARARSSTADDGPASWPRGRGLSQSQRTSHPADIWARDVGSARGGNSGRLSMTAEPTSAHPTRAVYLRGRRFSSQPHRRVPRRRRFVAQQCESHDCQRVKGRHALQAKVQAVAVARARHAHHLGQWLEAFVGVRRRTTHDDRLGAGDSRVRPQQRRPVRGDHAVAEAREGGCAELVEPVHARPAVELRPGSGAPELGGRRARGAQLVRVERLGRRLAAASRATRQAQPPQLRPRWRGARQRRSQLGGGPVEVRLHLVRHPRLLAAGLTRGASHVRGAGVRDHPASGRYRAAPRRGRRSGCVAAQCLSPPYYVRRMRQHCSFRAVRVVGATRRLYAACAIAQRERRFAEEEALSHTQAGPRPPAVRTAWQRHTICGAVTGERVEILLSPIEESSEHRVVHLVRETVAHQHYRTAARCAAPRRRD
eukprot:scaffold42015_cov69-Phaeocystis_antarctica.AAC.2